MTARRRRNPTGTPSGRCTKRSPCLVKIPRSALVERSDGLYLDGAAVKTYSRYGKRERVLMAWPKGTKFVTRATARSRNLADKTAILREAKKIKSPSDPRFRRVMDAAQEARAQKAIAHLLDVQFGGYTRSRLAANKAEKRYAKARRAHVRKGTLDSEHALIQAREERQRRTGQMELRLNGRRRAKRSRY